MGVRAWWASSLISLSPSLSLQAIQATLDLVQEQLETGKKVTMTNFGVFSVRDVPARNGRNPATGEALQIPAKRRPHFAFAAKLKEGVAAKT